MPMQIQRKGVIMDYTICSFIIWNGYVVSTNPWQLYSQKRHITHCTQEYVGHSAGLVGHGKSHFSLGYDPRTTQPVTCRYTIYDITATQIYSIGIVYEKI
jgi:hypothetical protein